MPEIPQIVPIGIVALLVLNLHTFVLFWWDKRLAFQGRRRIPEQTLLNLAFLGGWVGAKLAQRRFRHKTYKEPFRTQLNRIPVIWLILVVVAATAVVLAQRFCNGQMACFILTP